MPITTELPNATPTFGGQFRAGSGGRLVRRSPGKPSPATLDGLDRRTIEATRTDPDLFSRAFLGRDLWSAQAEILRALWRGNVAVRSGNGVGKTATAAQAVLQWMMFPDTIVVTTAPTWRQVERHLWGEIRRNVLAASGRVLRLPSGMNWSWGRDGDLLQTQWRLGNKWYAIGLATNEPENFQGFHADRVLVVADEASGIDDSIKEAIDGVTTGPGDRVLAIGNPTRSSGWFYDLFHNPRAGRAWYRFHIDSERLPWIVHKTAPPVKGLVSAEYIERCEAEWGRSHPMYLVRVRGEFADPSGLMLLTLDDLERAGRVDMPTPHSPVVLGVDIARMGDSRTVLVWICPHGIIRVESYGDHDLMAVTGIIVDAMRRHQVSAVGVDGDGIGAGVIDRLTEMGHSIYAYRGGFASVLPDRFSNHRSQSYGLLAQAVRDREFFVPPDASRLIGELCYLPYRLDSRGRLALLSKERFVREGRRSPDNADALAVAYSSMLAYLYDTGVGSPEDALQPPVFPGEFLL